jgi:hypothetical protein
MKIWFFLCLDNFYTEHPEILDDQEEEYKCEIDKPQFMLCWVKYKCERDSTSFVLCWVIKHSHLIFF